MSPSHARAPRDLVIVDPCMQTASVESYNLLSAILAELGESGDFPITGLRLCLPVKGNSPLRKVLGEARPAAVISLGSLANVTDAPPWMPEFAAAMEECVISAGVPLLGICFTHQWLAHHAGLRVDHVDDRHLLPLRKWHGARRVRVTHPLARLLLARLDTRDYGTGTGPDLAFRYGVAATADWDAARWERVFALDPARLSATEGRVRRIVEGLCDEEFWSASRHEQEVKGSVNVRGLVASATSGECAIEGFVHESLPVWTFQTHPEYLPGGTIPFEGRRVLKTFLYLAGLKAAGRAAPRGGNR